jgi:hypothetical protein
VTDSSSQKRRVRVAPNLYQRPKDGKYEAGFTAEGKWHIVTLQARTLTEAKKAQRELPSKADKGQAVAPSRLTVSAAWTQLEAHLEGLVAAQHSVRKVKPENPITGLTRASARGSGRLR